MRLPKWMITVLLLLSSFFGWAQPTPLNSIVLEVGGKGLYFGTISYERYIQERTWGLGIGAGYHLGYFGEVHAINEHGHYQEAWVQSHGIPTTFYLIRNVGKAPSHLHLEAGVTIMNRFTKTEISDSIRWDSSRQSGTFLGAGVEFQTQRWILRGMGYLGGFYVDTWLGDGIIVIPWLGVSAGKPF